MIPVELPTLSARAEDVPLLVRHFVHTLASSGGGAIEVDVLPPALVLRAMRLDDVAALAALDGSMSLVARRLGLGRATLYRKLAQYGIAGTPGR